MRLQVLTIARASFLIPNEEISADVPIDRFLVDQVKIEKAGVNR
jgi:hypothetical protein